VLEYWESELVSKELMVSKATTVHPLSPKTAATASANRLLPGLRTSGWHLQRRSREPRWTARSRAAHANAVDVPALRPLTESTNPGGPTAASLLARGQFFGGAELHIG
jgi:hypothetical protein